MAVNAIGAGTQTPQANLQTAGVGLQDFLKILLTQLQFQDPLKPMDNQQFIAQLAQFSSLQQTQNLNDRVDSLLSIQAASQSIGLVGKTVEVTTAGSTAVGQVTTIQFRDGAPELTIRTEAGEFVTGISPAQVTLVR
jgi:flagellar basal-body rod modification protein FlgD